MNEEDLYRIIIGQICSGMIASGRTDDNQMFEEATCWAKVIMGEKYKEEPTVAERKWTGFYDATGRKIFVGDIFVYDVWVFNKGGIPDDLIEHYQKKYSKAICLYSVFCDEDNGMWASDVYGVAARLSECHFDKLFVVTNNIEHPELYNH